jgi:hypothetical protein
MDKTTNGCIGGYWFTLALVALIISGKESEYMNNIDIYLHPLMDELMRL